MARIVVESDDQRTVLMDERSVKPEHMNDEHSALQLMQRLVWAVEEEDGRRPRPRPRRARLVRPPERALDRTFD